MFGNHLLSDFKVSVLRSNRPKAGGAAGLRRVEHGRIVISYWHLALRHNALPETSANRGHSRGCINKKSKK
jgi:hypothetical protein